MSKFVFVEAGNPAGRKDGLAMEICEAVGIDPTTVRRLVIDLEAGSAAKLYLETFADDAILDVSIAKLGIGIVSEETA